MGCYLLSDFNSSEVHMEMVHIFSVIILITLFLHKEKLSDNITGKFTRWTQIWGTLSYLLSHFSVFGTPEYSGWSYLL